jgi:hypothetical protein
LPLPTGEGAAHFADNCVVAIGQALDKVMNVCLLGRRFDLCLGGIGFAIGNVRANGCAKEDRILQHNAEPGVRRPCNTDEAPKKTA